MSAQPPAKPSPLPEPPEQPTVDYSQEAIEPPAKPSPLPESSNKLTWDDIDPSLLAKPDEEDTHEAKPSPHPTPSNQLTWDDIDPSLIAKPNEPDQAALEIPTPTPESEIPVRRAELVKLPAGYPAQLPEQEFSKRVASATNIPSEGGPPTSQLSAATDGGDQPQTVSGMKLNTREEYDYEGHSSQYGPQGNRLITGDFIGLHPEQEKELGVGFGDFVHTTDGRWLRIQESASHPGTIEFHADYPGQFQDKHPTLTIDMVRKAGSNEPMPVANADLTGTTPRSGGVLQPSTGEQGQEQNEPSETQEETPTEEKKAPEPKKAPPTKKEEEPVKEEIPAETPEENVYTPMTQMPSTMAQQIAQEAMMGTKRRKKKSDEEDEDEDGSSNRITKRFYPWQLNPVD